MTIHLDTSILVDAFSFPYRLLPLLENAALAGHRIQFSTPVAYEWLRGHRTDEELRDQERMLPLAAVVTFDAPCARRAAVAYRHVRRARGREMDLAIAACAIEHDAALWTLNPGDFDDIPGLTLYKP